MTDADAAAAPETGDGASPEIGYEAARDELIEVVKRLESGGLTLEESIALWERGEALAAICQTWLEGARQRLAAVAPDPD
jgi:exodeoxyribonuclease VII small subunit